MYYEPNKSRSKDLLFSSPCWASLSDRLLCKLSWFSPVRSRVVIYRLDTLGSAHSRSADFASSKQLSTVFPRLPSRGSQLSSSNRDCFFISQELKRARTFIDTSLTLSVCCANRLLICYSLVGHNE